MLEVVSDHGLAEEDPLPAGKERRRNLVFGGRTCHELFLTESQLPRLLPYGILMPALRG
jgi:hypothetical protein